MLAADQIDERGRRFPERCRGAGLKVTHQRTAQDITYRISIER